MKQLSEIFSIDDISDELISDIEDYSKNLNEEDYNFPVPGWNRGMKLEPRDAETKEKISKKLTGVPLSDERKLKISKTTKLNYELFDFGFKLGHASAAGSIGGKSKSKSKVSSAKINMRNAQKQTIGSVWMFNPSTMERKRVKKDMVTEYENKGFVQGMKNENI